MMDLSNIKTNIISYDKDKFFSKQEKALYLNYKKELWSFTGESYPEYEVVSWYLDILDTETNFIRIYDGERQIGFIFIGVKSNCHRVADYYIQDAYILPEYRRNHIMETIFQRFIFDHLGRYSLFLIDNNLPAISFWTRQFNTIGYKELPIVDFSGLETDTCHLHLFG